jgi:hypothetical protein
MIGARDRNDVLCRDRRPHVEVVEGKGASRKREPELVNCAVFVADLRSGLVIADPDPCEFDLGTLPQA